MSLTQSSQTQSFKKIFFLKRFPELPRAVYNWIYLFIYVSFDIPWNVKIQNLLFFFQMKIVTAASVFLCVKLLPCFLGDVPQVSLFNWAYSSQINILKTQRLTKDWWDFFHLSTCWLKKWLIKWSSSLHLRGLVFMIYRSFRHLPANFQQAVKCFLLKNVPVKSQCSGKKFRPAIPTTLPRQRKHWGEQSWWPSSGTENMAKWDERQSSSGTGNICVAQVTLLRIFGKLPEWPWQSPSGTDKLDVDGHDMNMATGKPIWCDMNCSGKRNPTTAANIRLLACLYVYIL